MPVDNALASSLAVAPSNPRRVYLAAAGIGVFRSDDRGETWIRKSAGLPVDETIDALGVSSNDDDLVFAGTGFPLALFRSTDGGESWLDVTGTVDARSPAEWLVHPAGSSEVFLATRYGEQPGLYRSLDDGASWSFVAALGIRNVRAIASHPDDPATIVVGVSNGARRTTDGGLSWTESTGGEDFHDLSWQASDARRLYAIGGTVQVYRSDDGGQSFGPVTDPQIPFYPIYQVAAHPLSGLELLSAGTGYGCFLSTRGMAWKSTDAGDSWSQVLADVTCRTGDPVELLYDPVEPTHVYYAEASRDERGFRHSTDSGETWTVKVAGIENYGVQKVRGDHSGTTYARWSQRLYRSSGSVESWQDLGWAPSELDPLFTSVLDVNLIIPGLLFEWGEGIFESDLFEVFFKKSTDFGQTWTSTWQWPIGLPPRFSGRIREIASNHGLGIAVYVVHDLYGLYRSVDSGLSFSQVNANLTDVQIVIHPLDRERIYIGNGPHTMEVSANGGASTTPVNTGLPFGVGVVELFMKVSEPDALVAVFADGSVYETFDGGNGWSLRYVLDLRGESIDDVSWDPGSGHVFVATREGVVSGHPRFSPEGLPTRRVGSVHYDPSQSALFAGTESAGLFHQMINSPVGVPFAVASGSLRLSAYPNPFDRGTQLHFTVPVASGSGELAVYDAAGRLVRRLVSGAWEAGPRTLRWDGRDRNDRPLASGVYFVRLRAGNEVTSERVVRVTR